jgi:transposase-like protein
MPVSNLVSVCGLSSSTVSEWTKFLRQLVGQSLETRTLKIGGPGVIVEIDETKMGKRKFNRGHRVEGVWVVCGVERTAEKRYFAISVANRNSDTLKQIIQDYVNPGSLIFTDMWRAYAPACEDLEFEHHTVNHSLGFKDPITGVHTNTVEGFNNGLKTLIRPRNRTRKNIDSYLLYFIWRKQNKKRIWEGFLKSLQVMEY